MQFLLNHLEVVAACFLASVAAISVGSRKKKSTQAQKALAKAVRSQANEPTTLHPEINPSLCAGCGSCTSVCPEGDILQLIHNKAVLVGPSKCVGHGECERACPTGAIRLVFGTKTRGVEIPRITANYETNVAGLYIAGELGGMGLIRNAIKQGSLAAKHAIAHLKSGAPCDYDLLIIGAGPAGLAACLAAVQAKKTYLCIDQNTFGGTVSNFPRQKIVMSAPAQLPIYGDLKFKNNRVSKESLLERWKEIRVQYRLNIRENTRFESLEPQNQVFNVKTSNGVVRAQKVVLAMGVRGSPRKLGLPNEDLAKVTYQLLDPEQYQGQEIVVVGGGNAGVEAAQYLGNPKFRNRVKLLVRGADFDRCNEENKNKVNGMAARGEIEIWFQSSVTEISPEHLKIKKENEVKTIPNHFLFIFAGAEMPFQFLKSLGVQIDKKFGEALGQAA